MKRTTKNIKFNLICDGKHIRTIEDLKEHFVIEDVLAYYNNNTLQRWLEVRGFEKEYNEVKNIEKDDMDKTVKELVRIFAVESDEAEVDKTISILHYLEERKIKNASDQQEKETAGKFMKEYMQGYSRQVDAIIDNPRDTDVIKNAVDKIAYVYFAIFEMTCRDLYWLMAEKSPLALMRLLMNEVTRKIYLGDDAADSPAEKSEFAGMRNSKIHQKDKEAIRRDLIQKIQDQSFLVQLGEHLKRKDYSGFDYGWHNLETGEKQYMIISMTDGDKIRPAGNSGEGVSQDVIKNKFKLMQGIEYNPLHCYSGQHELKYMEVWR